MTVQVNITSNGRMSLPADIRKRLGLQDGGQVLVEETEDGVILRTVDRAVARAGDREQIFRSSRSLGRCLPGQAQGG